MHPTILGPHGFSPHVLSPHLDYGSLVVHLELFFLGKLLLLWLLLPLLLPLFLCQIFFSLLFGSDIWRRNVPFFFPPKNSYENVAV